MKTKKEIKEKLERAIELFEEDKLGFENVCIEHLKIDCQKNHKLNKLFHEPNECWDIAVFMETLRWVLKVEKNVEH